jgi:hypothetical protein
MSPINEPNEASILRASSKRQIQDIFHNSRNGLHRRDPDELQEPPSSHRFNVASSSTFRCLIFGEKLLRPCFKISSGVGLIGREGRLGNSI